MEIIKHSIFFFFLFTKIFEDVRTKLTSHACLYIIILCSCLLQAAQQYNMYPQTSAAVAVIHFERTTAYNAYRIVLC